MDETGPDDSNLGVDDLIDIEEPMPEKSEYEKAMEAYDKAKEDQAKAAAKGTRRYPKPLKYLNKNDEAKKELDTWEAKVVEFALKKGGNAGDNEAKLEKMKQEEKIKSDKEFEDKFGKYF